MRYEQNVIKMVEILVKRRKKKDISQMQRFCPLGDHHLPENPPYKSSQLIPSGISPCVIVQSLRYLLQTQARLEQSIFATNLSWRIGIPIVIFHFVLIDCIDFHSKIKRVLQCFSTDTDYNVFTSRRCSSLVD